MLTLFYRMHLGYEAMLRGLPSANMSTPLFLLRVSFMLQNSIHSVLTQYKAFDIKAILSAKERVLFTLADLDDA